MENFLLTQILYAELYTVSTDFSTAVWKLCITFFV